MTSAGGGGTPGGGGVKGMLARAAAGEGNARVIAICVGVLIAIFAGFGFAIKKLHDQEQLRVYKANGWCPTGTRQQVRAGVETPGHTAIVIDTSNRISDRDGEAAFAAIDALLRDTAHTPYLQRISVYGLPESEHERPEAPAQSLCVPMQGSMADVLYQNPRVVNLEFRDFVQLVKVRLDSLLARPEAPSSPIAETMATLAGGDDELDTIVIVSDMMQHTSACDLYDGACDLMRPCAPIREGSVESVHLYYVDRRIPQQPASWPDPTWGGCLGRVSAELLN